MSTDSVPPPITLPPRVLHRRSLRYERRSGDGGSAAGGLGPISLPHSPMLSELYAVLLLGSKDVSPEELDIYDAFVRARLDGSSGTAIRHSKQHGCNGDFRAVVEGHRRQPILVCADGAVVGAAVSALASSGAGEEDVTATAAILPLAFDALCGDFDSVPPQILSVLSADAKTRDAVSGPSSSSSIGGSAPAAEYFHVSTLYEDDCQFVSDVSVPLAEASTPSLSPAAHTNCHRETREGPAAASLSKALNRRHHGMGSEEGRSCGQPVPPAVVVKVECQMTTDFEKCCQLLEMNHLITSHATAAAEEAQSASAEAHGHDQPCHPEDGARIINGDIIGENVKSAAAVPQVLVLGALGGRMDHEFAVLNTLFHYAHRLDLTVYNGLNTLFAVPPNTVMAFTRNPLVDGDTVGVVVFGSATNAVVTKGLQWELGPELKCGFGYVQSTSNKIVGIVRGNEADEVINAESLSEQLIRYLPAATTRLPPSVEPSLLAGELRSSFIVDTRACPSEAFVLVTIPRNTCNSSN